MQTECQRTESPSIQASQDTNLQERPIALRIWSDEGEVSVFGTLYPCSPVRRLFSFFIDPDVRMTTLAVRRIGEPVQIEFWNDVGGSSACQSLCHPLTSPVTRSREWPIQRSEPLCITVEIILTEVIHPALPGAQNGRKKQFRLTKEGSSAKLM